MSYPVKSPRPTLATMKKSILNFAKGLIPQQMWRAIEIILSPCCSNSISSIEFTCNRDEVGNYDITINLANSINLLGKGKFYLFVNGIIATSETDPDVENGFIFSWSDGNSVTITNVNIGPSTGYPSTTVFISLFLPTSDNFLNSGSSVSLPPLIINEVVVPDCS